MKLKPILPGISMLGMYSIVFISIAIESRTIVQNPDYFLVILAPLGLFYASIFLGAVGLSHLVRFSYEDTVALAYGTAGKNISIALALASLFFSPLTVFVLALKPIIQIAFMAGFLRLTPRLEKWFPHEARAGIPR